MKLRQPMAPQMLGSPTFTTTPSKVKGAAKERRASLNAAVVTTFLAIKLVQMEPGKLGFATSATPHTACLLLLRRIMEKKQKAAPVHQSHKGGPPANSSSITWFGSVKWGPISKEQEDEVEWVRAQLSETERECGNLVTQKNLFESGLLQGMAGIIRGSTKVAVDIDEAEMQKRLRESRAKKAEKSAGKRPRDDDEGRVADVLGKRKALEEAHQHVMGSGPRLPPFDLQAPPKLPFGMEDVFAEGVEKVDFGRLRQQKKEVNLAMHRQEVPLVNVFLEGVKSDPEALAKTPASSFIDRAQKTILTSAY
ncbi:PREDICTED: LOC110768041 isoform, partial [Prunus dulcis]